MIQPIYHDNTVQIPLDFPFSLEHIFTCGQCFRWQESPRGGYVGVALGRPHPNMDPSGLPFSPEYSPGF